MTMTTKQEPENAAEMATQDNTTVALDMDDLADAARAQEVQEPVAAEEGSAETRPIPIGAGASYPPASKPLGSNPSSSKPLASKPSASNPPASSAPKTESPAASAPPATPDAATPTIAEAALVSDDPNATNQLPPSSGLTGLDVLGSLDESNPAAHFAAALREPLPEGIVDEVDPAWKLADQPTLEIKPQPQKPGRPAFLETGEQAVWPPRPTPPVAESQDAPATPAPYQTLGNPRPIPRPTTRPILPQERLASPTGRRPLGNAEAAYSDPRMRRYVELRMQRGAHEHGQRGPTDMVPVTQMVRQWWSDLLPGLQRALDHQHEARASGVYPLPAHDLAPEPKVATRLGDAFGRLAATVRDLSERAQSAAMPTLNRIHERAEQAAQAIVGKLEGPQVRQQAPFLGPGRLAVFFRQGVTVGQAQRLLLVHRARPMRLIPRKHGFLAMVIPGREAAVGAELRQHPYVRDVVYLEYEAEAAANGA